jgi:Holliday junction resolvase RusA-like endonuclease
VIPDRPLLALTIPGPPVGKARPTRNRQTGRVFLPKKTASWQDLAADLARWNWRRPALTGPVRVVVRAVAARPQRLMRHGDPEGRVWRTAKPDLDNVFKAAWDALVKGAVILDDTQIVSPDGSRSLYAAKGEGPCVEIEVWAVGELP